MGILSKDSDRPQVYETDIDFWDERTQSRELKPCHFYSPVKLWITKWGEVAWKIGSASAPMQICKEHLRIGALMSGAFAAMASLSLRAKTLETELATKPAARTNGSESGVVVFKRKVMWSLTFN